MHAVGAGWLRGTIISAGRDRRGVAFGQVREQRTLRTRLRPEGGDARLGCAAVAAIARDRSLAVRSEGEEAPVDSETVEVVHVLPHARSIGGSERMVLDLLLSPLLAGVRQRVAFVQPGPVLAFPHELVLDRGRLAKVVGPLGVARAIARLRPHVIHGWLLQGNAVGAAARLLSPASSLVTSERNVGHNLTPFKRRLERLIAGCETVATANSEAVRGAAIRRLPRRGPRLRVIPPGVQSPRRPARVVACTAVMVGRLHPVKDHLTALGAWAAVRRKHPNALLAIVGDGPARAQLESHADLLGLGEGVLWAGEVDPLPFLYGAQLFLSASRAEGFSRALLEALCAGLPCVCTEVGGIAELPVGAVRAVAVGDERSMALAVEGVLSDGEASSRALQMAASIGERFSWERCHSAYLELYRELGVS